MYSEYKRVCDSFKENAVLSDFTTFGIGGKAKIILFPKDISELVNVLNIAEDRGDKRVTLGAGSNVLISDEGFDGVVVITRRINRFEFEKDSVYAECGVSLPALSSFAEREGLSGLEFGCGIPATLGGATVMNAGAYGQTIGEVVRSVTVWERGAVKEIRPDFSYRKSGIKESSVVLSAILSLKKENRSFIKARIKGMREARASSQPSMRSAGCIFLSEDGVSAGYYVDQAGLKGTRAGEAEISEKHAGFIVNRGNATARDVVKLINIAREKVKEKFGKEIKTEIRLLGEFDETVR